MAASVPSDSVPISKVLIVGAGWTGRQIAGQMAAFGIQTHVVDPFPRALERSQAWILSQREGFCSVGYWPQCSEAELLERLAFSVCNEHFPDIAPDLVLESIPEQVALKRRTLKRLSQQYAPPCLLVSNSSYFTPSTFSEHIVAPERFAHFHFHVPVWRSTIVDIAPGPKTSEDSVLRLVQFAKAIGQTPIWNRAENTGYVFNWMLKALLQSALQLLEKGVATPEEIDSAWKIATGMPAGPFGIMDQIGLDIMQQTMSHARFVEGDEQWSPLLAHLDPLVARGHLGVKTGQGFFEYPDHRLPGG